MGLQTNKPRSISARRSSVVAAVVMSVPCGRIFSGLKLLPFFTSFRLTFPAAGGGSCVY